MSNSTHRCEVFRVEHLEKHPDADTLSLLRVFDAYQAVIRTSDFKLGDLAVYIPPDNVLPDEPQYAFLNGSLRIKACKLRGQISQGLVLPAPAGAQVGEDLAEQMKIVHYVPDLPMGGDGEFCTPPPFTGEKYDAESFFRYASLIPEGTMVEITEKLDGANTRVTFQEGQMWAGSREHYRKENQTGIFWRAVHENPWLENLARQNPNCVIYGETFGRVQDLRYGADGNRIFFRVFDILTPSGFMGVLERYAAMAKALGVALEAITSTWTRASGNFQTWHECHAPILYAGPYSKEIVQQLMDGPSTFPGAQHEREGVVIKPFDEKWTPEIGRLILKAVGPEHLGKDKGKKKKKEKKEEVVTV
jgi:RNA ligase (TIGR02306 family)